ncbi:hypothetical protein CAEBREN_03867 [Caenorhabditis brenneri]|uniref:Uncharacterized protein n=1 Tax=Caenorhabditis brenneri TaxID=135651 RepID=G0P4U4_CAEBE|nr:hypothetical protein CAEBREN_03867 [Caenorhabditis brenneri]
MVPNSTCIPVIDHQEGTSSSFKTPVPVPEVAPRREWLEETKPDHLALLS